MGLWPCRPSAQQAVLGLCAALVKSSWESLGGVLCVWVLLCWGQSYRSTALSWAARGWSRSQAFVQPVGKSDAAGGAFAEVGIVLCLQQAVGEEMAMNKNISIYPKETALQLAG